MCPSHINLDMPFYRPGNLLLVTMLEFGSYTLDKDVISSLFWLVCTRRISLGYDNQCTCMVVDYLANGCWEGKSVGTQ